MPLLIHFNFATNILITPDIGTTNLLTIGHSQSFQTISGSSYLHTCLHLRDKTHKQSRPTADSKLLKPMKRYLNSQKTLGLCIQSEQSAPMKSAQLATTSLRCSSSPETPSISSSDATCAPWITSSLLPSPKPSKSKLGQRNHRSVPLSEQRSNSSGHSRAQDQVQWQIWCHHSPGPIGPTPQPRSTLGFHLTGCHDRSGHLHLCHRHLPLEVLSLDQRRSDTETLSTTHADAGHRTTTSSCTTDCTCTNSEASPKQQCHSD